MKFSEELAVVIVILCDFTIRKFQRRRSSTTSRLPLSEPIKTQIKTSSSKAPPPEDAAAETEDIPYLTRIEDALCRCRTKLSAAHARSRIRARVLSIESLLPSNVRQNDELASRMNVCSWVNYAKTRCDEMMIGNFVVSVAGTWKFNLPFLLDDANFCCVLLCAVFLS